MARTLGQGRSPKPSPGPPASASWPPAAAHGVERPQALPQLTEGPGPGPGEDSVDKGPSIPRPASWLVLRTTHRSNQRPPGLAEPVDKLVLSWESEEEKTVFVFLQIANFQW